MRRLRDFRWLWIIATLVACGGSGSDIEGGQSGTNLPTTICTEEHHTIDDETAISPGFSFTPEEAKAAFIGNWLSTLRRPELGDAKLEIVFEIDTSRPLVLAMQKQNTNVASDSNREGAVAARPVAQCDSLNRYLIPVGARVSMGEAGELARAVFSSNLEISTDRSMRFGAALPWDEVMGSLTPPFDTLKYPSNITMGAQFRGRYEPGVSKSLNGTISSSGKMAAAPNPEDETAEADTVRPGVFVPVGSFVVEHVSPSAVRFISTNRDRGRH